MTNNNWWGYDTETNSGKQLLEVNVLFLFISILIHFKSECENKGFTLNSGAFFANLRIYDSIKMIIWIFNYSTSKVLVSKPYPYRSVLLAYFKGTSVLNTYYRTEIILKAYSYSYYNKIYSHIILPQISKKINY